MEDSTEADIFYSGFQLRGEKVFGPRRILVFSEKSTAERGLLLQKELERSLEFFGVEPHRFWGVSYMGKVCTCV